MKKIILTTFVVAATVFGANAQNKHYVTVNGSGAQDGSSWANAKAGIQWITTSPAIYGDTIMLQQGVYKQAVTINKLVHIYGGFAGTETNTSQSNPDLYPTIFDADIEGNDIPGDYVTNKGDNISSRLFSFTSDVIGNGIVYGITFKNAYLPAGVPIDGAAVSVYSNIGGSKIITFRKCQFLQNSANTDNGGGAIAIISDGNASSASAIFDQCLFDGNANRSGTGRGSMALIIANYGGGAEGLFTNCMFYANNDMHNVTSEKALIFVATASDGSADLTMHNNTFVGNYNSVPAYLWNGSSTGGAGVYLYNNINLNSTNGLVIIGDAATANHQYIVTYRHNYGNVSIVNHTTTTPTFANNIIGSNPLFVGGTNYNLTSSSPCIDAGQESAYVGDFDYAGNNRTVGTGIDIGAYEYQGTTGINDAVLNISLSLYPNPAHTVLNIEVNENTSIRIVNLLGETVATHQINEGSNSIDVSDLTSGVYFLQTENGLATKFVKE